MKRVLLIAYLFPPISATGAMRPLNFCRQLPSLGWMPYVLSTDLKSVLPPQPCDERALEAIPNGVEVLRVAHSDPRGQLLDLRARIKRKLSPSQTSNDQRLKAVDSPKELMGRAGPFIGGIGRLLFEWLLEFPDRQRWWFRPALSAAHGISVDKRPEVILATGGPWTSLLVGRQLAKEWKVPFIADFRDPWFTHEHRFSSKILREREKALESTVFAAADRILLNTEELKEYYLKVYPEHQSKLMTLTNGYPDNLETFYRAQRTSSCMEHMSYSERGLVEVCHFGTVYGHRNPKEIFRALEELFMEGVLDASKLRLRFVGTWDVTDQECELLARSLESKGLLRREAPMPHRQCLEEMGQAGWLLALQQNYPLQIPAKLYEYIVAGRPLLVIGGEGATANLVQRHRLGRCCRNTVPEIKRELMSLLLSGAVSQTLTSADTEQFSYRVLASRLADLLNRVSEEHHGARNRVW